MNQLISIWHGLGEIWSHKLRSVLSLFSVFLGVASLIVVVGFINGLFLGWERSMYENGGIQRVSIMDDSLPEKQRHLQSLSTGRTIRDADALSRLCHNVSAVSPEITLNDSDVQANGKNYRVTTTGVRPAIFQINRFDVTKGRLLSEQDVVRRARVAVVGQSVADALFPFKQDPVGKLININGVSFMVVGLLEKYSFMDGSYDILAWKNKNLFIPITTFQDRFSSSGELTYLNVQVENVDRIGETVQEVNNILIHAHRGLKDFRIVTTEDQLADFNRIKGGFTITGQAIGAITLLVGGVGIMNLMMASINERIREIGIRKALGAWSSDIFIQIVSEAACLSGIGGLLGVAAGWGVIKILQQSLTGSISSPQFSLSTGLTGFGFSLFIGVIAGLYPGLQAARLDPIEALRYE